MAAWDYAYQAGDEGGTFTDISDYAVATVLRQGGGFAGRRGSNPTIPYQDGEYSEPFKFMRGKVALLETNLRYTNAAGAVTHTNDEAGHAHENLSALKVLLGAGSRNRRMLRRNDPDAGLVETAIECLPAIDATDRRYVFTWILRMMDGMWREQSLSSDTESSMTVFPDAYTIATGGNYEIGDAKITFTCVADGSNPSLTQTVLGETITVTGAFVAADEIIIDLGRDRAFTLNGARYGSVSGNRAWWMRLAPDEASLGMSFGESGVTTGTWTCKIEWRNKWL